MTGGRLDLRAVEARLKDGPAWMAAILKAHVSTIVDEKRLVRCACGLEFHFVDAKAWHRHAAAMVWNASQEEELFEYVRALRAALQQARPFIIRERRPTMLAQLDAVLAQAIDGET